MEYDFDVYLLSQKCVPYRSSISHRNAFMFKGTQRSIQTRSGLDYSKVVLIRDHKYLDTRKAIIDKDEYNETLKNMPKIAEEVNRYVEDYIAHVKGTKPMHPRDYMRKYQFSTLPYFHEILGIDR